MKINQRLRWMAVGGAIALVGLVSVAAATPLGLPFGGEDDNTIYGCYSSGGTLKVLTPDQPTCPKGYTPIHWNVEGPQGAPGAPGPQGPQGIQGIQGPQGPSGAGPVYYARNEIVIYEDHAEVVGLSDLPAGSYIFTVTASSRLYFTENGVHVSDMSCFTTLNGPGTNLRDTLAVAEHHTESLTLALTVPEGSKFTLRCSEDVTQGDDATLAVAWVLAQKVTAINP